MKLPLVTLIAADLVSEASPASPSHSFARDLLHCYRFAQTPYASTHTPILGHAIRLQMTPY